MPEPVVIRPDMPGICSLLPILPGAAIGQFTRIFK
jgi:hypothetical protein